MASAASKRLLRELPTQDEMSAIISDLKSHGDQATAIMGAAYLEHALERVLQSRFIRLTKENHHRIFDGSANGILGSFSPKIRIAYALNMLGPSSYSDLKLINDIRNVFAHSLHKISFDNPFIASDCKKLQSHERLMSSIGLPPLYGDVPIDIFSQNVLTLYLGLLNMLVAEGIIGVQFQKHWLDDQIIAARMSWPDKSQ